MNRLVVTTGGTGGHIFPALAVAGEVRRRHRGCRVLFLGGSGPEGELAARAGLEFKALPAAGLVGKGLKALSGAWATCRGLVLAMIELKRFAPEAVLGFGGFAGFCPVLAAKLLGIPAAVHEQNSIPGLSNRILGKTADLVFVSFAETAAHFPREKVRLVGNPVRGEIAKAAQRGPDASMKRLLVLGGSQGARAVNDAVVAALPELTRAGVRILHQAGKTDEERVRAAYRAAGLSGTEVQGFIEDMAQAYAFADLVLCRAGASTLFELALAGRPALLVPFPFAAHDHQRVNARVFAAHGGGIAVEQERLAGCGLARLVLDLFSRPEELARMAEAARKFARPKAAQEVVSEVERLAEGPRRTGKAA